MPINVLFEGDVVVLSNFGRLLNDPRHFDAGGDVREELDKGTASSSSTSSASGTSVRRGSAS